METVWFYNGTKMSDGKLCSVGATNEAQVAEYIKDGCIKVDEYNDQFGKVVKKAEPKTKKVVEKVEAKAEKVVKKKETKEAKKSNKKNITKSSKD